MEQKIFETSLSNIRNKEFYFSELVNQLPVAIYTCDQEGRITYFNKAAENLWGRQPLIGIDLWCGSWKIWKTDGTALALDSCQMAVTLKEGRAITGEEIIIERPDGSKFNILPNPQPLVDEFGIVIGAVNTLIDITAEKQKEKQLKESELRFQSLADIAPVMIWITGSDKDATFFNKHWVEFTGMPNNKQLLETWTDAIHPNDRKSSLDIYISSFEARTAFSAEYRMMNHSGEYRWISSFGVPRYAEDNTFLGYIGSAMDIHDQKIAGKEMERMIESRTAELKLKNEELERSNSELASFSYVASHDLQEPLRKIITFSNRLQQQYKNQMPPAAGEYLDRMTESARRMSRLIEDVLNFSRVSRSNETYVDTDLNDVIKNVLKDFDQRIAEKQAVIEIDNLPVIAAIPIQMTQLFHNLISNALKFSPPERSTEMNILYRQLDSVEVNENPKLNRNLNYIEIRIRDNGIGFEQEFGEKIFAIFQRLHGKSEYAGTGIGLALCRKITDNHSGSISAFSNGKDGAVFTVLLPVQQNS